MLVVLLTHPLADGHPHRALPRPQFLLLSLLLCSVVLLPMHDSLAIASSLLFVAAFSSLSPRSNAWFCSPTPWYKKDADQAKAKIMTDEGIKLLVRTRLSLFQAQFDGKTNKNDQLWEHVKAKFDEGVTNGMAAESDNRRQGDQILEGQVLGTVRCFQEVGIHAARGRRLWNSR
jgi:hypothetical protein